MSKKCFITLIGFIAFLAVMTATAFAFSSLELSTGARIGIGVGAFVVLSVVGIIGSDSSAAAVLVAGGNAAAFGMLTSILFAELGAPEPSSAAVVAAVAAGWLLLYCLYTNVDFAKGSYRASMGLWGAVAIGGALAFAFTDGTSLGWFAVILLAPAAIYFVALILDAEDSKDQLRNMMLASSIVAIIIFIVLSFFRTGAGELSIPSIGSDSDDPYSFDDDDDDDD